MKRSNVGDLLLEMGAIDRLQLQAGLAHQRKWGMPLGKALTEQGFCSRGQLMAALSRQAGLPSIDLDQVRPDASLVGLLGLKLARKHKVVPLRLEGERKEVLVVAIAAPATLASLDEARSFSGKKHVSAFLADDDAIERAIGRLYLGYAGVEAPKVAPLNRAMRLGERELEPEAIDPREEERPVLVFGWEPGVGKTLALLLASEGIPAKVCGREELARGSGDDLVLAPLPAAEAALGGASFRGRLLVAVKRQSEDLARVWRVGACGVLLAPVEAGLLVQAVRRTMESTPPKQAA
ncbi:MAG: hypothetical protein HYZ28_12115 [Myxococcales bacterium]|nr:hypothetical protein [Myxococcales bacterium]